LRRDPAAFRRPESVDLAGGALYKGLDGGGRNPAAAVLWAATAFWQAFSAFGNGLSRTRILTKASSVDHAV
jgi:hypothetical protein